MRRILFLLFFLCLLPALPAQAAPCSAPVRDEGVIIYNSNSGLFQYCNGTDWIGMSHKAGTASGDCDLSPYGTRPEGAIVYNKDQQVLQGCSGGQWMALGGTVGGTQGAWTKISAGLSHACGIKKDGSLWCWGRDSNGQLGNGADDSDQISPVRESSAASNWAQISVGYLHTCAVRTNGTLWCWGQDTYDQLGNGATTVNQDNPVQEVTAATNWAQVSAGGAGASSHTCAVKTNGTLWCWGSDGFGQVGNGATTGNQNTPVQIGALTTWAQVSAGSTHSCALRTDGTLWCWGQDGSGQVGNASPFTDQNAPVQESTLSTNWVSLSAGTSTSCAVRANGTLWCWGTDANGQLGNGGTTGNQPSPSQESTAATDWVRVSAGGSHVCGVKTNGALWCWGSDSGGALGNGPATGNQISPVQEETTATNWAQIATGNSFSCAIKTNGTLWCWGRDSYGRLGNGNITGTKMDPGQESTEAVDWVQISVGGAHSCAIKAAGTLWCWGSDISGQLGNGATTGEQTSPVQEVTGAGDWAVISAGNQHSCAVKTNGTLWCWGSDSNGQLGNGATTGDQASPVQEATLATDWTWVGTGYGGGANFTCALKTNRTLWCWGGDSLGQLGNGAGGNQDTPGQEATLATNWAEGTAGTYHNCAVRTDGTLWCWGHDGSGQLGNGATTGAQHTPVQEITGATDWRHVVAGNSHTCAIKVNGTLWCWGDDSSGQIGNGATIGNQDTPVQEITGATDWQHVALGSGHTCAVKMNGTMWCWGSNRSGAFGSGLPDGIHDSPVVVPGRTTSLYLTQLAKHGAGTNSCAIRTDGTLWCWGDDSQGQTGTGSPRGDGPVLNAECLDPLRSVGVILYNSVTHVLQYCDGNNWVRLGR